MLSPVSPPSESSKVGVVLRAPTQTLPQQPPPPAPRLQMSLESSSMHSADVLQGSMGGVDL